MNAMTKHGNFATEFGIFSIFYIKVFTILHLLLHEILYNKK
jgi:hypothetical protein